MRSSCWPARRSTEPDVLRAEPLKTIKTLLAKYIAFLDKLFLPLGVWGVFGFAIADSAFYGAPLDIVVATYVATNHANTLWYLIMASAGSAVGSLVPYALGWKGGEMALAKRVSKERFERIRKDFEEKEFWALVIPSMLPPPFPFKVMVFAAGVFEMKIWQFLASIFVGRMVRFGILALIVIKFPQLLVAAKQHPAVGTSLALLTVALGLWLMWRFWKRPVVELEHELEHKK
jgi:membrane protein YqaA with SNARE-associated domain